MRQRRMKTMYKATGLQLLNKQDLERQCGREE